MWIKNPGLRQGRLAIRSSEKWIELMTIYRTVKKIWPSVPTIEGAGVHLKRAFGFHEKPNLDPFLLLDHFASANPDDYINGFPWHPHRGIETITYMISGSIEHRDSLDNKGIIESGDIQWMTAGSGIIHQEMPKGQTDGTMAGLQLWANLPAANKMMAPRYQEIKSKEIPTLSLQNGTTIKVICGKFNDTAGAVNDIVTDPQYLDIVMPPNTSFELPIKSGYTVFAYVINGMGSFNSSASITSCEQLVTFNEGDCVKVTTSDDHIRFLLVSGKPINEPIAWYGPIVMNTEEELKTAFSEYMVGTFLKHS